MYDHNAIALGYGFVAPYALLAQERFPLKYYQPCQSGPVICDGTSIGHPAVNPIVDIDMVLRACMVRSLYGVAHVS